MIPPQGPAHLQRQAQQQGTKPPGDDSLLFTILDKASKVKRLAESLDAAAKKLSALASKKPKGWKGMLVQASNLASAASNLAKAAQHYEEIAGRLSDAARNAKIAKAAEDATKLVKALIAVAKLADTQALNAFLADPSDVEKAKKWAKDVGDTFQEAANGLSFFPDLPFVSRMLRGYLSAPGNYIEVFNQILERRTAQLDEAGAINATAAYWEGTKEIFKGDLARTYTVAPAGLKEFMLEHKNTDGINLADESISRQVGIAHLMNLIDRDVQEPAKTAWRDFLESRL